MKKFSRSVEKTSEINYNKRKQKGAIKTTKEARDKVKTYIGVFLALVIVFTGGINSIGRIFAASPQKPEKTIIIDAGHGGFDSGAVANDGTLEKDLNLSIAKRLKSHLSGLGYNIILTRETDEALKTDVTDSEASKRGDMKRRVEIMQAYPDAIFLSIHQNKFEQESVCGLQVFYSSKETSDILAKSIQSEWNEKLSQKPREAKSDARGVYILRNATVPSVIIECGFVSNSDELRKLKSEKYQNELCSVIKSGIINYYKEIEEIENG